jgi:hypothetical protein
MFNVCKSIQVAKEEKALTRELERYRKALSDTLCDLDTLLEGACKDQPAFGAVNGVTARLKEALDDGE